MGKATGLVSVLVLAMLLASCASTGTGGFTRTNQPPAEATDTPVEGGVNVQSGSEEDFIVNVGRRTFFAESCERSIVLMERIPSARRSAKRKRSLRLMRFTL